jgi:hypothetical protein
MQISEIEPPTTTRLIKKFYLTPASAIERITRSACSSSDFV